MTSEAVFLRRKIGAIYGYALKLVVKLGGMPDNIDYA